MLFCLPFDRLRRAGSMVLPILSVVRFLGRAWEKTKKKKLEKYRCE